MGTFAKESLCDSLENMYDSEHTRSDEDQIKVYQDIYQFLSGYALLFIWSSSKLIFLNVISFSDVDECRDTSTQSNNVDEYSLSSSDYSNNGGGVECDSHTDFESLPVHNCHENARCRNTIGSFVCVCDGDYDGDGVNTCECKLTPTTPL